MASPVDRLARDLAGLRQEVRALATVPGLSRSSIDGGALELRDIEGNVTGYVGEQFDGTFTSSAVGGSYPSTPSPVLVTPRPGGLAIYWDGTYEDGSVTRMDFRRVTIHAVPTGDELNILSPAQIVGEINTAAGGEITASLPPVEYLVYAVTWTESGKFSPESEPGFGTPLSIVDSTQFDDISQQVADLVADSGNLGELSDLVALINKSTGTQHLIY